MARRSDYEKFYNAFSLVGTIILLTNIYYYCHPLLRSAGMTLGILDGFMGRLRLGGVFNTPLLTKAYALGLMSLGLLTKTGKASDQKWYLIVAVLIAGAALYIYTPERTDSYLFSTVGGLSLLLWSIATAARKFSSLQEANNDRDETFRQCERLYKTPDSVNIRMRYKWQGRWRNGWINVINPFRATMVLGTPGSGKSFSVYGPYIEQMLAKGYTMFVYDYKYPSLSQEVYNEAIASARSFRKMYGTTPEFCVINFNDPRHSLRCNPINPRYITDPADTTEIAELIMLNVSKTEPDKEDFFSLSAKVYLDALIWFLKIYKDGRYCTFPHVIELMAQDYKKVFEILANYPELEAKIKPFANALEGGAQDQLQGQIASAQIPLNKFVSKSLYWVLTGDDFSLDINDPLSPKILCVGNDPDRQVIYGTTLALFTSRMFKLINHPKKAKCAVLLDELPTIYLKGLDNLIATARSNKVAIVLGAQDKSQLKRDYGDKESEVIFNTVGNVFSGQVNGKTAEGLSKTFGKEFRKKESETQGIDQESRNVSFQKEELLPMSNIETLSQGMFMGKVADKNEMKISYKLFCGEIKRDMRQIRKKEKNSEEIPVLTSFGEEKIRAEVMKKKKEILEEHVRKCIVRECSVVIDADELARRVDIRYRSLSAHDKSTIIENIITARCEKAVQDAMDENFRKVKDDVRRIIQEEYLNVI